MNIIHSARYRNASVAFILLSAFLCWAAPASAGEIIACVNNKNGATRIISPPDTCRKRERLVRLNQQEAVGPLGRRSDEGDAGPQGPSAPVPAGHMPGDMLYWDGNAWVIMRAVVLPEGAAPRLTLCNGVPGWVCYKIGDTGPAGGRVFHVTEGGTHGLEAAPNDLGKAPWGCEGIGIPAARKTEAGAGASNTRAILAQCSEAGIAARLASDYTLNGYRDWFLPSKDELDLLYQQRNVVGAFGYAYDWSSSEGDANLAWYQSFSAGPQVNAYKNNLLSVRPVRAF